MQTAKVIGTATTTVRHPTLAGCKLLVVQPYHADDATPVIEKGSTILITGGARGITSAIALQLAERYQPNLILAGRSPLPSRTRASSNQSARFKVMSPHRIVDLGVLAPWRLGF